LKTYPRVLPVGDSAVTVEFGDAITPELNAAVRALDESLREDPVPGLRETVPAYRSLLVCHDGTLPFDEWSRALLERAGRPGATPPAPGRHVAPTLYGGEAGPDLASAAAACGLTEAELVSAHSGQEYMAYMVGFMPGFAYLGTLPEELAVPRKSTPRVRVPAGSVAIAGPQTAIYPAPSPGGWNLIGRAGLRPFDPRADRPSLIAPGDLVRFEPVLELPPDPAPQTVPLSAITPAVEVMDGGLLTSVQDAGRPGHRRQGVGVGGALDSTALATANRAVGNEPGTAGLEATLLGPTLRFLLPVKLAWTGADLRPVLDRTDLGPWPVPPGTAVLARPGNVLRFEGRRSGCRAYLAFAGGVDVPALLGSRGTDLVSGFGGHQGRALRAGDLIALGHATAAAAAATPSLRPADAAPQLVKARVVPGPQADFFTAEALRRLLGSTFRVAPASDRVGLRLQGPRLAHAGPTEIVTDGLVSGCIQVPPDGQPILTLADGPTTGGYPKIATVVSADLPALAQLVPGEGEVRFEAV